MGTTLGCSRRPRRELLAMANGRIGSAWDLSVPSTAAHRTALAESTNALVRHDAASSMACTAT
jgi:hypothetical protein